MISIVWQFAPKPEKRAEFERIYGSHGAWAQLFRTSPGYIRTDLLRDREQQQRYLCIDVWKDLAFYEAFKQDHGVEYQKLDRECEQLTREETRIGVFESL